MSAKGAIVKSRGFEALLNSFDKLMQNAVRVRVWGRPLPPCARRRAPAPTSRCAARAPISPLAPAARSAKWRLTLRS